MSSRVLSSGLPFSGGLRVLVAVAGLSAAAVASANLLGDGGFEQSGTAGINPLNSAYWSSDLPYFIDNPNRYDVVNGATPGSVNPGWRFDLLAKEGTHYLLVDGPTQAGQTVLRSTQTLWVTPGAGYSLSAFLAAVDSNVEPVANLTFTLGFFDATGHQVNQVQKTVSAPALSAGWQEVTLQGYAGTGAQYATISITDSNTEGFGNDFALDDFKLDASPVPEPASLLAMSVGLLGLLRGRRRE